MVTITPAPASGPGALAGFRCVCDACGLVFGSSLPTIAASEARDHEAWHARQAAAPSRRRRSQ